MGMVEINVDFVKHGGNPRATHLCLIIVKLHFARSRNFTYEVVRQRRRLKAVKKNCTSKIKCQFIF
jgi:hypothetical protein